jgi:predicted Rossmann fold flavoprotein
MQNYDVIVIGAGAAGLMCAIEAGKRGRRVLVLDHANKVGKKILLSGGGRCNFTNLDVGPDNYLCGNPHFCKSALSRYTSYDFIALVEKHRVAYHERKHGQLFCDDSARHIVALLVQECHEAGVEIRTDCRIQRVEQGEGFELSTGLGAFRAASLVVATGGLSFPKMGASGFGYELARQFGLRVLPTRAGLVPFTLEGKPLTLAQTLSGVALETDAGCGGQRFRENTLFTHRGLSGPAILQVSSYWQPGEPVSIDLLPEQDAAQWLRERKQARPQARLRTVLAECLPNRFAQLLEGDWYADWIMQQLGEPDLQALAEKLNGWQIRPSGTEGYRTAEVTLGGVDTDELSSKTMEARKVPGLYFVGEVMDVTGWLGGYNFQWAWASGYAAGQHV